MPAVTVYLSRLIGLVALIAGVAMLIDKQPLVSAVGALSREPALLYVMGILGIVAGVAIVLVHNVWTRGLCPLIVTLIGWLLLIRGIVVVLLPADLIDQLIAAMRFAEFYYLYAAIPLVLGAYLTLRGFGAPVAPEAAVAAPAAPPPKPTPKRRPRRRR
jgi:hypothetical protein